MTYETRNLLKSVLELSPKNREYFLTKIYDSLQEYWQKKEIFNEENQKNPGKISSTTKDENINESDFFKDLKSEQNQLLFERVEKMKNGQMAYFSFTQLQKKIDIKLNELNLN